MEILGKIFARLNGKVYRPSPENGRDEVHVPEGFSFSGFYSRPDCEALEEYLSVSLGKPKEGFQVYRCPNCKVKIAHEEDMVRKPCVRLSLLDDAYPKDSYLSVDVKLMPMIEKIRVNYNAVFRRTFNLVNSGLRNVHCYRCGIKLYEKTKNDHWNLTLPLIRSDGERTFLKTPFRLLSVYSTDAIHLAYGDSSKIDKALKKSEKELRAAAKKYAYSKELPDPYSWKEFVETLGDGKKVEITSLFHFGGRKDEPKKQRVERLTKVHDHPDGLGFKFIHRMETEDSFNETYDMCILHADRSDGTIVGITDFYSNKSPRNGGNNEILYAKCWQACGGNFLFSTWEGKTTWRYINEDEISSLALTLSEGGEEDGMYYKTRQHGLVRLIRDGHFLGNYIRNDLVYNNPEAVEKAKKCLNNNLLYPQWQFIHDYCPTSFIFTEREPNGPPSYLQSARDRFIPGGCLSYIVPNTVDSKQKKEKKSKKKNERSNVV